MIASAYTNYRTLFVSSTSLRHRISLWSSIFCSPATRLGMRREDNTDHDLARGGMNCSRGAESTHYFRYSGAVIYYTLRRVNNMLIIITKTSLLNDNKK